MNWEDRLVLFIGFLIEKKRKASTIKSYISAIKAILREDGFKLNVDEYLLKSMTRACTYKNDKITT